MGNKLDKEILIQNLPDYITNNISDKNLISGIESELETNADFRFQYEELKKTFNFLDSAGLESPSESYFNNLSVKINDKIIQESLKVSFRKRLNLIWKILIPAISIVLIAIILFSYFNEENVNTNLTGNKENKSEVTQNITTETETMSENIKTETVIKESDIKSKKEKAKTNKNLNSNNHKNFRNSKETIIQPDPVEENPEFNFAEETATSELPDDNIDTDEVANESDADIFYSNENFDEENLEDEFFNLTPLQQQEIIKNLKKVQI